MKEFGPSWSERFAQGSTARQQMIEANLAAWGRPNGSAEGRILPTVNIGLDTERVADVVDGDPRSTARRKASRLVWAFGSAGLALAFLTAIGKCDGAGPEPRQPGDTDDNQPKAEAPKDEQFILPAINTKNSQEPIFLNSGPHFDGLTGGVRAAFDLAGKNVMPCPGSETSKEMAAIAAARGKVTVVGNEKDPTDKNHSIVEITLDNGLTLGYMHLDDIQVKVSQEVKAGQILGFLSCEIPPKGKTDGQHLHFYIKKDGKFIPIKGLVFSGWQIDESPENYQGTAQKGNSRRVANKVRCGPERYLQEPDCNGQRNDLAEGEVLGAKTAAPTPTLTSTPTPEPTSTPTPEQKRAFPDPYLAALDWYVRNKGVDPATVGCALPKLFCIDGGIFKGTNVAGFHGGCFGCGGSIDLWIGQHPDGLWEVIFNDPNSRFSPGPGVAIVTDTGDCLNIREKPSLSANRLACLKDKTRVEVQGGEGKLRFADGYIWVTLKSPQGWSIINYLASCDPEGVGILPMCPR